MISLIVIFQQEYKEKEPVEVIRENVSHEENVYDQQALQTFKLSKRMFHDENIQLQLSVIKDKARNAEAPLEQDITFYTGYIIGVLTLKLLKKIELVVGLTNKDYFQVYHEPTRNLYIMHNDKMGCAVLDENEFSHFKFYFNYIRPVFAGSSQPHNGLFDPFFLNANGTPIRNQTSY